MNTSLLDARIESLIKAHTLPNSYRDTVQNWLVPIAYSIAMEHPKNNAPQKSTKSTALVLGVQGAQGSGKSTCSDFLKEIFESAHQLTTVVLSIDDFYLTRAERETLAKNIHPLLQTRGVPGTHDTQLAIETINTLKSHTSATSTPIPRFSKAKDDRATKEEWDHAKGPIDIIILEGWFIGLTAQQDELLLNATNTLEQHEDPNRQWRTYVNQQLKNEYAELFALLDKLIVLKAPSFDCVYRWRKTQEDKLINSLVAKDGENADLSKTLTPDALKRFIAHYERLTEHALSTLPQQADWCLHLDANQKICEQSKKPEYIIFTDLDGTLLDHHTYEWSAVLPSLSLAKKTATPVIINTSKTMPEVVALQKELGISEPFIIENGSAMYIPKTWAYYSPKNKSEVDDYYEINFGVTREKIVHFLSEIRSRHHLKFESYSDWSIEDVMSITGLDKHSAAQSLQRKFSEPLIWKDTDKQFDLFSQSIEKADLKLLKGGRFYHVLGKTDKSVPIRFLMNNVFPRSKSISLGDSPNDIDMLLATDIAICVKSPKSAYPISSQDSNNHTLFTQKLGPEGWQEAMYPILSNIINLN